jgi:hypothetical protein
MKIIVLATEMKRVLGSHIDTNKILLSDVLAYLHVGAEFSDEYQVTNGGDIQQLNVMAEKNEHIGHWDLSKPYLHQQSDKLIEFLNTI